MYFVEFAVWPRRVGVDPNDLDWTRTERSFATFDEADEEAFGLSGLNESLGYRVVEEPMNKYESVALATQCGMCGAQLELAEGGREHLVQCPVCDAEPGEGSTQAAPVYLPSDEAAFVVPKHPWVVEVDGFPFASLTEAEAYAQKCGQPIYCRLGSSQKAANQ